MIKLSILMCLFLVVRKTPERFSLREEESCWGHYSKQNPKYYSEKAWQHKRLCPCHQENEASHPMANYQEEKYVCESGIIYYQRPPT